MAEQILKVLDCAVTIKAIKNDAMGQGIVVNKRMLLTALHGYFEAGDVFEVIDRHGISKSGVVKHSWYEAGIVDIAIIELNEGIVDFNHYIQVKKKPVKLGTRIALVGRKQVPGPEEYAVYYEEASVTTIVNGTCLFH